MGQHTLAELKEQADNLVRSGVRPSTQRTYNFAQNKFCNFCCLHGLEAVPTSEEVLLLYVAYLYKSNLACNSVKVYLSAVR